MSEIQAAFRKIGGEALDEFTDDELTLFIGSYFPELREHPAFSEEYGLIKEDHDRDLIDKLRTDIEGEEQARQETTGKQILGRLKLGLGQGVAGIGKAAGSVLTATEAVRSKTGMPIGVAPLMRVPAVRRGVERMTGAAREQEEEFGEAGQVTGGGLPGEFAQALSAGATTLVPTVVGAYFGGLPGAMAVGGLLQFGDTYDRAVNRYVEDGIPLEAAREQALKPALISGTVTAGLTSIGGAERFFARLGRGAVSAESAKAVIKQILTASGLEGIEEGADQFAQGLIERATFNPEKNLQEILFETAMASAVGATLGGLLPVSGLSAQNIRKAVSGFEQKPETLAEEQPLLEAPTDNSGQALGITPPGVMKVIDRLMPRDPGAPP